MNTRRKYTLPGVDFTPFANIALLLIVFFIWIKMTEKPTVLSARDLKGCRKGIAGNLPYLIDY